MTNNTNHKKCIETSVVKAGSGTPTEAELRFRAIFEQSPYGIVIIGNNGALIEFNEAAHSSLHYSREEFAELRISDIDPLQTPQAIRAGMRKLLKKGQAEFETRHRTKEGDLRNVHVITRVVNVSGNRVFQAIWHDITERKQAEEELNTYRAHLEQLVSERTTELETLNKQLKKDIARRTRAEKKLRESEERFRRIFDDGPLGMVIFSPDYRILNANKALTRMLGYAEQELTGRGFEEITFPEDIEASYLLSQQLVSGKIPLIRFEKRYIKRDGKMLWANVTTAALRDESGEVSYALSMIEDINSRKLNEQERERLIRELQDAMAKIKTLRGLLPMCAWCKKVRDDNGYWKKVETYIEEHSVASFTHGICPECLQKSDPETYTAFQDAMGSEFKVERRRSDRKPYSGEHGCISCLHIDAAQESSLDAAISDTCESGMCIKTYSPIKPDTLLRFGNGMGNKTGLVRWSQLIPEENMYKVGLQFLPH